VLLCLVATTSRPEWPATSEVNRAEQPLPGASAFGSPPPEGAGGADAQRPIYRKTFTPPKMKRVKGIGPGLTSLDLGCKSYDELVLLHHKLSLQPFETCSKTHLNGFQILSRAPQTRRRFVHLF
jgi:hypothetical protein